MLSGNKCIDSLNLINPNKKKISDKFVGAVTPFPFIFCDICAIMVFEPDAFDGINRVNKTIYFLEG